MYLIHEEQTRLFSFLVSSLASHLSCRSCSQTNHQPPLTRARSTSDLFNPSEVTAKLKRSCSARSLDLLSIDDDLDFSDHEEPGASETCSCYPVSLDTCYDIICDTDTFQVSSRLYKCATSWCFTLFVVAVVLLGERFLMFLLCYLWCGVFTSYHLYI